MPGGQRFENGDGLYGRRRCHPLVRSAVILDLPFEDGADDHGDRVVAAMLNAAGLQMQDLACPRPHEVRDDDKAGGIQHVDHVREVTDCADRVRTLGLVESCLLQCSRRRVGTGVDAATALAGQGHRFGVDLPCPQDAGCTVGDEVDGPLDQGDGDIVRGMWPAPGVSLAHAGDLAVAASRKGIELQPVTEVIAKAVEVGEQVEVLLHGRRGQRGPRDAGPLRERALELQQRRGVEIGKARETRLIHPTHQFAQVLKVASHGTCAQRQPGTQRATADERDKLPAALQQRRIPVVGETPPAGECEVPAQSNGSGLFERVGRLEEPDRVLPS